MFRGSGPPRPAALPENPSARSQVTRARVKTVVADRDAGTEVSFGISAELGAACSATSLPGIEAREYILDGRCLAMVGH